MSPIIGKAPNKKLRFFLETLTGYPPPVRDMGNNGQTITPQIY